MFGWGDVMCCVGYGGGMFFRVEQGVRADG